jgi:hypothetical protein
MPRARSRCTSHQPQGNKIRLAPKMRQKAMSKGVKVPPRVGSDEARAMMMKDVQISTVVMAEAKPMARGEKRGKAGGM